ncbi:MAG: LacI family DNA-binding transcriptional regulator [Armatimonadetes bacterium]|nr:LacI family DNA-binding transcriptional regulator [Armatimonadota bacterium]
MPATIREVAQAAGVSRTAVSKVLHGKGNGVRVSPQKAAAIREIAEKLNYKPNALARSLLTGRTHTVGLLFEHLTNISGGPLYYVHLFDGVASALFNNEYRLTILPKLDHDNVMDSLGDGQLEGIVWCKLTRDDEAIRIIHESPIPIVAMNALAPDTPSEAIFISCDNDGGMDLAVEHLWEMGHRKILFAHEGEERATPDCMARLEGFTKAMAKRTNGEYGGTVLEWDWHGYNFKDWWAGQPEETAIICWTERFAGSLLQRAAEIGVSVPNQLSVIGFDSTQYCETTSPRLTCVRQPIYDMAKCAGETLLAMIRGNRPQSQSLIFPCTFDVRDSTAKPLKAEHQP